MGWIKWIFGILLVLGALGGGLYYWFFVESALPEGQFALDMAEVRRTAEARPGALPEEVRVEHVATFRFPGAAVVAGDGFAEVDLPVYAFQLVYGGGATGIIDTAMLDDGQGLGVAMYDREAYGRMSAALAPADFIVVTHGHPDHIGGLMAHPDLKSVLPDVQLTAIQLNNRKGMEPVKVPDALFAGYKPISYERMLAIAPGVVLIAAPGHTPGSQMIYVKTASGAEYLFAGDIAWHMRNIDALKGRARAVSQFFLNEDRDGVMLQLDALKALKTAEPALAVIPGHDKAATEALVASGRLVKGFK